MGRRVDRLKAKRHNYSGSVFVVSLSCSQSVRRNEGACEGGLLYIYRYTLGHSGCFHLSDTIAWARSVLLNSFADSHNPDNLQGDSKSCQFQDILHRLLLTEICKRNNVDRIIVKEQF